MEEEYIEETREFLVLREYVTPNVRAQKGHMRMAYELLKRVLHRTYGKTSVSELVKDSVAVNASVVFCKSAMEEMAEMGWARSTQYSVFGALKKILADTAADASFVRRLGVSRKVARDDGGGAVARVVGVSRWRKMSLESRKTAREWIDVICAHSRNKCTLSLRNVMSFWFNKVLPVLPGPGDALPTDTEEVRETLSDEDVLRAMCGGARSGCVKKMAWLQLFVSHILEMPDIQLSTAWTKTLGSKTELSSLENDGTDGHRVSIEELEKLYVVSKDIPRDHVMFLILITTGMRIGGLAKIRTRDVADGVKAKQTGRTLEKGGKWFAFAMAPIAQKAVVSWIRDHRPVSDSAYLFPSKGGAEEYISTNTLRHSFNRMCERAGIGGKHLHPHSLRHSYAHILLEVGNDADKISKLLGHNSTDVTERFYLRESAAEVARRSEIPWLPTRGRGEDGPVPWFLLGDDVALYATEKTTTTSAAHIA